MNDIKDRTPIRLFDVMYQCAEESCTHVVNIAGYSCVGEQTDIKGSFVYRRGERSSVLSDGIMCPKGKVQDCLSLAGKLLNLKDKHELLHHYP